MLEQGLLENDLATTINHILMLIAQESFLVDQASLVVDAPSLLILLHNWLTTWIHLNLSNDSVDVESREWEDLREFAVLKLSFQEEDFAFTGADMAISSHYVAFLVDHETCLVYVDIFSTFILAKKQLNITSTVAIKDTHNFLKLKCLSIVVVELGHEASKLSELLPVEALDSIFIDDATLVINQEALKGYIST